MKFSGIEPDQGVVVRQTSKFAGHEYESLVRIVESPFRLDLWKAASGPPRGPGDYEVVLVLPATGETVALQFSAAAAEAPFKLDNMTTVSRLETPDQRIRTSFDAWDGVAPLVTLASGSAREVVAKNRNALLYTWTYEGIQVAEQIITNQADEALSAFLYLVSPLPAGDYEMTVVNRITGDKLSTKFNVTTDGRVPTPTPGPR